MKHFIQFDENGEIQFVVRAEFEAVIADEHKNKFMEISAQKAQELKGKLNEHKVEGGKLIKKVPATAQPKKDVIQPTLDK
jgi:hypothetical protein